MCWKTVEHCRRNKKGMSQTHTHIHSTGQRKEVPVVTRWTQATVTTGPNSKILSEMISGSEP